MLKLSDTPLWTAIVTPFLEDGRLDRQSFEQLLQRQAEARNGVVILGSTGEALALSEDEKREVVELACSLNLNVPLMVGVGGFHLASTLEWIEYCETQKLQAYLMVTPLYAKPNDLGQKHWFESLLQKTQRACMLYNVPSRTGCSLSLKAVSDLKNIPHFAGLKEASGQLEAFKKYAQAAPQVPLFSGDDALTPLFCQNGAQGLVSVASNVWPKATRRFVELCLQNRSQEVLPLWEEASQALFSASNPIPVKALLHHKKWIQTPLLKAPLCAQDMRDLDQLVHFDQLINEWFEQQVKQ